MTCFKPFFLLLGILLASPSFSYALDYGRADRLFKIDADYDTCRTVLDSLYNESKTDSEKAEVLWRISRVCLVTGKLSEGCKYAEEAIQSDPQNPGGYMWHCACVGTECKTKSIIEQAKSVPIMLKDLDTILETLHRTDYSEAWQAKAEIYYHHPFKSNESAIEFMRRAIATIPADEIRISSSLFLAEILNDKEEAKRVLEEARQRYLQAPYHSSVDEKDYEKLTNVLKTYQQ